LISLPAVYVYEGQTYHTIKIGKSMLVCGKPKCRNKNNGSADQTNNSTIEKYCYGDVESNVQYMAVYTNGQEAVPISKWSNEYYLTISGIFRKCAGHMSNGLAHTDKHGISNFSKFGDG